jgi:hypothetical protein
MRCAIGLFECLSISEQRTKGVQQCLDVVRQVGFNFLVCEDIHVLKDGHRIVEHRFRVATEEDVQRIIEAQRQQGREGKLSLVANASGLYAEHPLLEPGDYHAGNSWFNRFSWWPRGVCQVKCAVEERWLNLTAVHEWGRATVERHARTMLELARRLWKLTQPICATVGLFGSPPGYSQQIRRALARGKPFRWRELEWANILSAELVADVGREFLLGAPWEESEFWEDGAFLGITRSSYQQWLEKGARPLLSYLRRKYPNLRRVKEPT